MKHELRDLYESYTRDIRYNTYKYVNEYPIVVMGHNHDDCFENILTNISQQRNYDTLTGMKIDSRQDNIRFIRPLLNVPKTEIYRFAYQYDIPHLPDSTPEWSQRGKIRTIVRPTLTTWDPRIINGFFKLNEHMSDLHQCLELYVIDMITKTEFINEEYIINLINPPKIILYWRLYIKTLFDIVVSYKSLNSFITRLNNLKDKIETTIPISKQLTIKLIKNNHIYQLKFFVKK
jgi:tRNA(Ile)-lysidine synthase TilS/MesJ